MEIIGIDKDKIKAISSKKDESSDILKFRLDSYNNFLNIDMPKYGPKIDINFDKIVYYKSNEVDDKIQSDWSNVLRPITDKLNELGVIGSEKHLSGMGVQWESEVIYHSMVDEIRDKNIIFTSIEDGFKRCPEIFSKYFGKIVKNDENKFAALNSAVFSGGSFIYVPPYTKLDRPLQSYFRINSRNMGQFERTLIVVDHDSEIEYIEGCTATSYSESSLHAAVVEIYVGERSKCRYSSIQNWAKNVYNLVTKRAVVEKDGVMEWMDGNLGSKVTMKYPACILKGDNSTGVCIRIGLASSNQEIDSGARMIHLGHNTKSTIISKSISRDGGNSSYRGKAYIDSKASNSSSDVKCDTLILDDLSKSDTWPDNNCYNGDSILEHEATVAKISEDNLFYMMSRGIERERAIELIILGFIERFRRELPVEYAVELNQLIKSNL